MKVMKVKTSKKAKTAAAAQRAAKGAGIIAFDLQDNGDNTLTVLGTDAAGATLDISSIASLTPPPTSSDITVVTVDAPTGMTFGVHAATPAPAVGKTATITMTAAWNDSSIGPFTITLPVTIRAGGATGIIVEPGTPTVH